MRASVFVVSVRGLASNTNRTLQIEQGPQRLDFGSESFLSRPCDLDPRACSLALVTFADCHESMMFQNLNVLAKISVRQLESRLQIGEIGLLSFTQNDQQSEACSLMDDVVQLCNVEIFTALKQTLILSSKHRPP